MGVTQFQLIVYSDVVLLESQILQQDGANVKETKSRIIASWNDHKDSEKECPEKCFAPIPLTQVTLSI